MNAEDLLDLIMNTTNFAPNCTPLHYSMDSLPATLFFEISYQILFILTGLPLNLYSFILIIRRLYGTQVPSEGIRSWMHLIHLNLILADFLIIGYYCAGKTLWQLTFYWYAGDLVCRTFIALSSFGFFLWSSVAVVSSLDMCYSMICPFQSHRKGPARVKKWLGACWVVSLMGSGPQLALWGTQDVPEEVSCLKGRQQCVFKGNFGSLPRYYQLFHVVSVFYIPLLIIICAYIGIGFILFRRGSSTISGNRYASIQHGRSSEVAMGCSREVQAAEEDGIHSSRGLNRAFLTANRKFLRVSLSVILTYTLAWLPYQIVALMRMICGNGSNRGYQECIANLYRFEWLEGIMILGACVNPIIYRFRSQISKLGRDHRLNLSSGYRLTKTTLRNNPPN